MQDQHEARRPKRSAPARRTRSRATGTSQDQLARVDEYLSALEQPERGVLEELRGAILDVVPQAEQVISYGVPAFRVDGRTIAGFAAFKNHLGYLPFSGSVLEQLGDELDGYEMTKSSLHFPVDRPLPRSLVEKLIATRLAQR